MTDKEQTLTLVPGISDEELGKGLLEGKSLGQIMGIGDENITGFYELAYTLYSQEKYEDAEKIFAVLCMFDEKEVKYWLGLGGCRQKMGRYEEAASSYAAGAVFNLFGDPEPLFYAAQCMLKAGKREIAVPYLELVAVLDVQGNAKKQEFVDQAAVMLQTLKDTAK